MTDDNTSEGRCRVAAIEYQTGRPMRCVLPVDHPGAAEGFHRSADDSFKVSGFRG